MKKVLSVTILIGLLSVASALADPTRELTPDSFVVSEKIPGSYQLVEASGGGAAKCPERLLVSADNEGVAVTSVDAQGKRNRQENFSAEQVGCKGSVGDIGPIRTRCTMFQDREIYYTDTSLITIVGTIHEYRGIRLGFFDSDILVYSHDSTMIPAGILGLWDNDKFKCEYKRVNG